MNILIGKMLGLGVHAFLLPSLLPLARTGLAESRKCRSNMVWRVEAEIFPPLQARKKNAALIL